jgi:hypothetical protein
VAIPNNKATKKGIIMKRNISDLKALTSNLGESVESLAVFIAGYADYILRNMSDDADISVLISKMRTDARKGKLKKEDIAKYRWILINPPDNDILINSLKELDALVKIRKNFDDMESTSAK